MQYLIYILWSSLNIYIYIFFFLQEYSSYDIFWVRVKSELKVKWTTQIHGEVKFARLVSWLFVLQTRSLKDSSSPGTFLRHTCLILFFIFFSPIFFKKAMEKTFWYLAILSKIKETYDIPKGFCACNKAQFLKWCEKTLKLHTKKTIYFFNLLKNLAKGPHFSNSITTAEAKKLKKHATKT